MTAELDYAGDPEAELAAFIAQFAHDPEGFVLAAWPWREPGGPLEHEYPYDWHLENLRQIGDKLRDDPHRPVRDAVAAANGVGKSAELAWIFWWLMATHEDTRLVVTAGTQAQLTTKTQPEIKKWHNTLICGHWFEVTAQQIYAKEKGKREHWRADLIPWSKHKPDSFQGLHNKRKRQGFLVDEASGVDDVIFEAMDGSLTDAETEVFQILRSNPMRREGRLYKVFTGPGRHGWNLRHVDGRDCPGTNKELIADWEREHGEDSDFFRVRVRGLFPKQGTLQFISEDVAKAARAREGVSFLGDPLVIGVDPARHGGDSTRIVFRRGRDAKSIPSIKLPFVDTEGYLMQLAAVIAENASQHGADGIFIDATGMGWGVVDRLKQMGVENVHAIGFGDQPLGCWSKTLPFQPRDRKTEIWGALKFWLPYGAIEDSDELELDLTGIYSFEGPDGRKFMESKRDMAARGLASPDWAEALACTFGAPVAKRSVARASARIEQAAAAKRSAARPGSGPRNPFEDVDLG
jgi:hypothetical protein